MSTIGKNVMYKNHNSRKPTRFVCDDDRSDSGDGVVVSVYRQPPGRWTKPLNFVKTLLILIFL